MKRLKLLTLFIPFVAILFGCTNDSTADLIDNSTVAVITYTNTTKSIFDNNCVICHATIPVNGAPMSLTTYENVKEAVLNRGLLDRISRPQGAQGMMPNGGTRLPQVSIDKISQWTANGLPE